MAKFFGAIGFLKTVETSPGIWEESITERNYYGDVTRYLRRWDKTEHLNDDFNLSNVISIVADDYLDENFYAIRYVKWKGVSWKIESVEVQRPRLILTIGGIYNGPSN